MELYNRVGRRMYINANGLTFLEYVTSALSELDLGAAKVSGRHTLSLAVDQISIWSAAVGDYIEARPDVLVDFRAVRRKEMSDEMLISKYSFLLSGDGSLCPGDEINVRTVSNTDMVLAVSEEHPLASRGSVSLRELSGEKFVFPSQGYRLYDLHMQTCLDNGLEPEIIANCGYLVRMQMVAANRAVSFVDVQTAETDIIKHVAYVPLAERLPTRSISIFWHKKRELSEVEKDFLEYITLYFQS